jgi:hypothetical protein
MLFTSNHDEPRRILQKFIAAGHVAGHEQK